MASTLNVAFFASGGGTTAAAALDAINSGELPNIRCGLVFASKEGAGVIRKALDRGINPKNIIVAPRREFADEDSYGAAIIDACRARHIDVIFQLGFIPRMPPDVVFVFRGRIANQHGGGLDPDRLVIKQSRRDFGGRGMMGTATHAAMFYYGQSFMAQTGATTWSAEVSTHHVENGIDTGDLIARELVSLGREDTLKTFVERLLPAEHALQIRVLRHMGATGAFPSFEEPLIPDEMLPHLHAARARATADYPRG